MSTVTPDYYNAEIEGVLVDPYAYADAHNISSAPMHAVKYITRAGKKQGETAVQAYHKAIAALNRAIEMETARASAVPFRQS